MQRHLMDVPSGAVWHLQSCDGEGRKAAIALGAALLPEQKTLAALMWSAKRILCASDAALAAAQFTDASPCRRLCRGAHSSDLFTHLRRGFAVLPRLPQHGGLEERPHLQQTGDRNRLVP